MLTRWRRLNDCNGSNNQQWSITKNLPYILFAGQADQTYCLDGGSNLSDGTQLKIWKVSPSGSASRGTVLTRMQCYSGIQAQNWTLVNDNSITNSGFCMDLPDGDKSNGNVVQEWQVS